MPEAGAVCVSEDVEPLSLAWAWPAASAVDQMLSPHARRPWPIHLATPDRRRPGFLMGPNITNF